MAEDGRIVVLGEDILDPYGGAFKVTRGISTSYPDRTFTTPICESTIAGMAVGLALRGMRPVAELMFGDFITIAADQIINHAAKFHAMYNGAVELPLVIRTPMGGGRGYGPTHSQSLEKIFLGIPHLRIVAPSQFHDPGAMLRAAIADDEPVLFIENKLLYPQQLRIESDDQFERNEWTGDGGYPTVLLANDRSGLPPDVTIIAYGGIGSMLLPLMSRMAREEIRVLACLPGSISPLRIEPILEAAARSERVVIVEEGAPAFGWGAEVSTRIYEAIGPQLKRPIMRIGAAPTVIPASKQLEEKVLVSESDIEMAMMEMMA